MSLKIIDKNRKSFEDVTKSEIKMRQTQGNAVDDVLSLSHGSFLFNTWKAFIKLFDDEISLYIRFNGFNYCFLKSAFVYKKGIAIELLNTEYRYDYALDPIQIKYYENFKLSLAVSKPNKVLTSEKRWYFRTLVYCKHVINFNMSQIILSVWGLVPTDNVFISIYALQK